MAPSKPTTAAGYNPEETLACERVLVSLLRGFGMLKDTLRLVGGLVPRYLTPERPPDVPAHAGTSDVDIVLDVQVMAKAEGYKALAKQLKDQGFTRGVNDKGVPVGWQWKRQVSEHAYVMVEFLQEAPEGVQPGTTVAVDGENLSAMAIPHAGMVLDWYDSREVTAELLDGKGVATETVHYADAVSFIVLKALAFGHRNENKDAGDLIHVMQYSCDLATLVDKFQHRLRSGQHAGAIEQGLEQLKRHFAGSDTVQGFERPGPVAYVHFLHDAAQTDRDTLLRAQRDAAALVEQFLQLMQQALSDKPAQ